MKGTCLERKKGQILWDFDKSLMGCAMKKENLTLK